MTMLLPAAMPGSSAEPSLAYMTAQLAAHSSPQSLSRQSFGRRTLNAVECPKCGKRSIVARAHNVYDCLNCSFHRELPPVIKQPARLLASQPVGQRANLLSSAPSASGGLLLSDDSRGSGRRSLDALLSSDAYSSLDLADETESEDSGQPWIFAAIAVIFGILLL
ncbi:MAG: hypothetical protein ACFB16_14705 [Phormidesmis sp.]